LSNTAVAAAVSLLASVAVVGLVRAWAIRRQILDHPNERSSHARPTPRGGGLGITLVTLAALAFLHHSREMLILYAVLAAISITGWLDDVYSLSSALRLAIQLACAAVVIWTFGAIPVVLGAAITAIWLAGVTNGYNFMDGIDGIAGLQAVTAGLGWLACSYVSGDAFARDAGAVVATAAFGFLVWNWAPAKIFMGDVGSTFLGFLLAAIPLTSQRPLTAFAAAVLLLWPFLFDTAFTMARRALKGENILKAHRSHLYQRLVISGWSHARVTALYGALGVLGAIAAVAVTRDLRALVPAAIAIAMAAVALWSLTVRREATQLRA
jgi:UDP-N-acetylmuramyl pentapeptide phosphotransferase/UDP-N-acetylglucosamine-1-phosphate transferase